MRNALTHQMRRNRVSNALPDGWCLERIAQRIEMLKARQYGVSRNAKINQTADFIDTNSSQFLNHFLAPLHRTKQAAGFEVASEGVLGHRVEFFLGEFRRLAG